LFSFEKMAIVASPRGDDGTLEYRLFFSRDDKPISPFHDIPLYADKGAHILHFLCEIPRGTNAKMEISTAEYLNPIKQDVKNGKLRFVHDKYPFNYGAFPQTWENANLRDERTGALGDKDPVDVVDLSTHLAHRGQVYAVKVLGVWAMIDEGETDWKVLAIDVNDPHANEVNSVEDVARVFPGKIEEFYTFLRDYKIPDGKPANQFAYDGQIQSRDLALQVIEETHAEWHKLLTGETPLKTDKYNISAINTSLELHKVSCDEARAHINL